MSYSNEFLRNFRPVFLAILKAQSLRPERVELVVIDEEQSHVFEPADVRDVLEQIGDDLNYLTVYTGRPAYFSAFAERMYEENGLVVMVFPKTRLSAWEGQAGNTQYTETKYYAVEREGDVTLRNLTENALKKANVKLTSGVMPYAYDKMKDFHMGYLSGFLAERRDIEQNIVQGKMQHTMRESAEKLMRDTISGYNSVSVKNTFFAPKKETWSYVLLPVWTITYKGRDGKVYYYSMNGQNGNICGDLPVDRPRLALTSLLTALGILVFGLLGGYFLW